MTIVAVMITGLFTAVILRSYWQQFKTRWYGIETTATVSLTDESIITNTSGQLYGEFMNICCYVRYMNRDGQEAEARLINPNKSLVAGDRIIIRYLPEREDYAVLTEITEN